MNPTNSINSINSINSTNSKNSKNSINSKNSKNSINSTNSTNSKNSKNSTNSTNSKNSKNSKNSTNSTNSINSKMTEIGPIPIDWNIMRLEDGLSILCNGLTKKQNKDGKGYPVTRIETIAEDKINLKKVGYVENVSSEELNKFKLEKDDILFSHINSEPQLGRSVTYKGVPEILLHGMNLLRIKPNETLVPEYLNFLFAFYRKKGIFIQISARAVNQNSINQAKMKALPIIRLPIDEQKRIAGVLSAVQEAKEKTQEVINAAKELKKSMMKHLFTYGPVSIKEAQTVPLKETEIGMIPKSWKVVELGEFVEKPKTVNPLLSPEKPFKYIDVSCVSSDNLKIINFNEYLGKDAPSRARKAIYENDVIFATVRPYLRRVALVPKEFNGQVCSTAFCVIQANQLKADPKFLFYSVSSDGFVSRVSEHQRGSSYPAISDKDVLKEKISSPIEIEIQQKIADNLSAIDQKIECEENKKKALEELFKTLLENLMTGKIRV